MIIRKCPNCGKALLFRNEPVNASAMVKCPACQQTTPYFSLKQAVQAKPSQAGDNSASEEHTRYVKKESAHAEPKIKVSRSEVHAFLRLVSSPEKTYSLKSGKNVIGRSAPTSNADIQIDTGSRKRMSREHIVIDFDSVDGKPRFRFSLFKGNLNDTFIGTEKVSFGDSMYLNPGDVIRLPDADLRLEVEDADVTTMDY